MIQAAAPGLFQDDALDSTSMSALGAVLTPFEEVEAEINQAIGDSQCRQAALLKLRESYDWARRAILWDQQVRKAKK